MIERFGFGRICGNSRLLVLFWSNFLTNFHSCDITITIIINNGNYSFKNTKNKIKMVWLLCWAYQSKESFDSIAKHKGKKKTLKEKNSIYLPIVYFYLLSNSFRKNSYRQQMTFNNEDTLELEVRNQLPANIVILVLYWDVDWYFSSWC